MSKHDFIDTVISKQRLYNILFYTGFHEIIIATEISTGGGGGGHILPKNNWISRKITKYGFAIFPARKCLIFLFLCTVFN